MTAATTVAGLALLVIAARDVFDTLFHPHGRGVVSEALIRTVWRVTRRLARRRPDLLSLAGPVAFITVVLSWVLLVVAGGALIIGPRLAEQFVFAPGVPVGDGPLDAVYVSLVALTSLGYGDIVAEGELLRLLGPAQAMIGLGILTASISWILSIYRVLVDYRSLAHELALLSIGSEETGTELAALEPAVGAQILGELTARLVAVRSDLLHFPIAYYFHRQEGHRELAVALGDLRGEAEGLTGGGPSGMALQAARLRGAIDQLVTTIDLEFLGGLGGGPGEILARWQDEHRQGPAGRGR